MLEVARISALYGKVSALEHVSLSVKHGEIACLLGANGAGKSTTLNCISGVVPITSGRITFEGEDISKLRVNEIVERGIAQVPEGREIFAEMTLLDNLTLGAWLRRKTANIRRERDRVYALFPRLREREKQIAGTLSGGEQQMLMIGRALMAAPKLLLMDEPSLGLSPVMVETLFEAIQTLNRDGLAILVVEQNARLALSVSVEGYILENGEIKVAGKSIDLENDVAVQEAYLGI